MKLPGWSSVSFLLFYSTKKKFSSLILKWTGVPNNFKGLLSLKSKNKRRERWEGPVTNFRRLKRNKKRKYTKYGSGALWRLLK